MTTPDALRTLADQLEDAQACRAVPGLKHRPLHYCPHCDTSLNLSKIIAALRALAAAPETPQTPDMLATLWYAGRRSMDELSVRHATGPDLQRMCARDMQAAQRTQEARPATEDSHATQDGQFPEGHHTQYQG